MPKSTRKSKQSPLLSVIIPVFNEAQTIETLLKLVRSQSITSLEIIAVDDGSMDGSKELLAKLHKDIDVLLFHETNQGKGAAIQTGLRHARGKIVLIQDADLEYDPNEYSKLLEPIISGRADAVYGSRFIGSQPHRVLYFWHYFANYTLTFLSNICTNLNLSDMETGYKVFTRELLQKVTITEKSFGVEPEITAKIAALGARIYEVGISYHGRTYAEGKKIGWGDAVRAVWVILKWGVLLRLVR